MVKTISRPADICNATWKKVTEFLPERDSGDVMITRDNGIFVKKLSNDFLDKVDMYSSLGMLYWIYMPE